MNSQTQRICTSCKVLRRKDCDGKVPSCLNCIKRKRECTYQVDSDKRRRKYHTDYTQYLEKKIHVLQEFLSKNDPQLQLGENGEESQTRFLKRVDEEAKLTTLLNEMDDLRLDHSPEPDFQYDDLGPLVGVSGLNVYYIDPIFRTELLSLFKKHCSEIAYAITLTIPTLETWDFSTDTHPSHQLLMLTVYGVACLYSKNPHASKISKLLINQAAQIAVYASKFNLDEYLLQGLLLLSCYEMGMGNDSMSYLYISMACSLTQHMGLHISYDEHSSAAKFAPRTTPFQSALLWSICTQDRIITSRIGVPSCIHFKRIISPVYEVQLSPRDPSYLEELCFCYTTRVWYIMDRFTDQICSIQGDLGDTQERGKLLKTAELAFQALKNSIPLPFRAEKHSKNYHIIMFQLNYEACVVLLHRLFIDDPLSNNKCVASAKEITRLIRILLETGGIERTSYHFAFICYLAAMIHLVLYSEKLRPEHLLNLETCVTALKISGQRWKRGAQQLEMLCEFSQSHGINVPILETLSSRWTKF
ncbi:hypothetical protein KL918_002144 [Ogataea parapolymorpha]|uniref:Zn(2)-C6 fungal-type domain-containing protein n=1 Tax=Ogataea parapolymorpha (strain ATCC 26012 / BCRC 20466 / JCM 22074 / NRRL Y-7560 / DL-1) TaxID=871575 RepID=W1QK90_OGAPD|nr:hypothetical protein HPODL_02385 [Ogataea parapolymorpha DL-1]ESX03077.1 hypothetical protein HPODL_02385 [Ogataea parapolymorpha DL-1]KAG7867547.1 hypothetical protein KL918_002144 [Ogataea parapolymorpha]KAG7871743.1 hypothetical protein KL916_003843 [Ogataea parapolymorpha]KAG7887752.1 hypothetical protein KL936_003770 [Ogataea polymorpha]